MAAIAGWVAAARSARDEQGIGPMLEALAHRNKAHETVEARVERRPRCQVVMSVSHCDEASQVSLVLDGALANGEELRGELGKRGYVFAQNNDAEIVLRAYLHWDKEMVKHLRGAFAIALWDGRKERLLLARDRFGEKPLHMREQAGTLVFASELKAFGGGPVDMRAAWDVLVHGYAPGPRTLVEGVRKLAPGTYALWQFGRLSEIRYWTPPDAAPLAEAQAAEEEFIAQLEEAVRLRMAPSCGAFLSGGLDSAAVVALMCRHGKGLVTFSAGFEGDKHSELPEAKRAAAHFGTEHHELVLKPRDVIARLPEAIAQRDAPLARPSDVALQLLSAHAAKRVSTVLTGEGGDEILGGYRRYAMERFSWIAGALPTLVRFAGPGRWPAGADEVSRESLLPDFPDPDQGKKGQESNASALRQMLYREQSSWLPDNVLERGDRVTMAASLEARTPFVDHRLAEFVSRLPDAARVSGLGTKRILREAARQLFPAGALKLRKGGFRIAVGKLLAGEMKDFLIDHLRGSGSLTRAWYEPKALDRAIDRHVAGRTNNEGLLWTLLNLEIWHRNHSAAARRA